MEQLERMVLLIDGDNVPQSKMDGIMAEASARGKIAVKRIYGNWQKESLRSWTGAIRQYGLRGVQQFDYVAGKNATDIALAVDAMDLMHRGIYDGFVLVSSDSDFGPLAVYLREAGVYVLGIGMEKTNGAYRNCCDEFVVMQWAAAPQGEPPRPGDMEALHKVLRQFWEKWQDPKGRCDLVKVGGYLKECIPGYTIKAYGHQTLTKLLEAYPERYEIGRVKGKAGMVPACYRCKTPTTEEEAAGEETAAEAAMEEVPPEAVPAAPKQLTPKSFAQREKILHYLDGEIAAKRSEIEALLGLSETRFYRILKQMVAEGMMAEEGDGWNRRYRLPA